MSYKAGDKVRYIGHLTPDGGRERFSSTWHPPIGTVGTIVDVDGTARVYRVQWPKNSTTLDDRWSVLTNAIEPLHEGEWGASCNPSFEELTGFVEEV